MGQHYVGLDVSLEMTSVCVLDEAGAIVWRGKVGSTPEALATAIGAHAPQVARIGLETGPLCTWHWHALRALGLPVVCLDARHAKAALSIQLNKTDANDAYGIYSDPDDRPEHRRRIRAHASPPAGWAICSWAHTLIIGNSIAS